MALISSVKFGKIPVYPDDVVTTGVASSILSAAPRTISKMYDSGRLEGYVIPDSKDRRIYVKSLLAMMTKNNMPIPMSLRPQKSIMFGVDRSLCPDNVQYIDEPIMFGHAICGELIAVCVIGLNWGTTCADLAIKMLLDKHKFTSVVLVQEHGRYDVDKLDNSYRSRLLVLPEGYGQIKTEMSMIVERVKCANDKILESVRMDVGNAYGTKTSGRKSLEKMVKIEKRT